MKVIQVTSWANGDRDFTPGRWVQLGPATRINFWLTGLPGGKMHIDSKFPWIWYERCDVGYDQHTTVWIDSNKLRAPSGLGADGWIKSLFGQRIIR